MTKEALTYVSSAAYEQELLRLIPLARRRIVVAAMQITWGAQSGALLEAMMQAQQRGVQVTLLYDRFSYLPFSFPGQSLRQQRRNLQTFRHFRARLLAAGGAVQIVGKLVTPNVFAGRLHAKFTVVDDVVFTFGGVNFTDYHFGFADYMLTTRRPELADYLVALTPRIKTEPMADISQPLDGAAILLFDGGHRGQSVIFARACELARQAQKVHYISQMCPSGELAKALQGKSTCYFNRANQTRIPSKWALMWDQRRFGIANQYQRSTYIHAKLILYEMPDGTKKLLSGSNNFSWRGVAFGTKEIAVESSDPELWQQLYDFYQQEIA